MTSIIPGTRESDAKRFEKALDRLQTQLIAGGIAFVFGAAVIAYAVSGDSKAPTAPTPAGQSQTLAPQ